jgi:hypothetical protein
VNAPSRRAAKTSGWLIALLIAGGLWLLVNAGSHDHTPAHGPVAPASAAP